MRAAETVTVLPSCAARSEAGVNLQTDTGGNLMTPGQQNVKCSVPNRRDSWETPPLTGTGGRLGWKHGGCEGMSAKRPPAHTPVLRGEHEQGDERHGSGEQDDGDRRDKQRLDQTQLR